MPWQAPMEMESTSLDPGSRVLLATTEYHHPSKHVLITSLRGLCQRGHYVMNGAKSAQLTCPRLVGYHSLRKRMCEMDGNLTRPWGNCIPALRFVPSEAEDRQDLPPSVFSSLALLSR
jgi:hypothetical protein